MHGRWRLFRHEAGQASGPPPWAYVAMFAACLLVGIWSARTFNAVVIWPANGVMLAAALQLHKRQAIRVLAACFVLNIIGAIVRGDPQPMLWLNPVLNLFEACMAALIARRVCGAALDLRRPKRLANFALLAVVPAVLMAAFAILSVVAPMRDYTVPVFLFTLHRFFDMETLGLLLVAPALLLIAKSHRFRSTAPASRFETAAIVALLLAVTAACFFQNSAPTLFVIFPFLLLVSFRTSPSWVAASIVGVAVIGAAATVTGYGPVLMTQIPAIDGLEHVPPLMRQLSVYYIFLVGVIVTALPVSTSMSERRRLIQRLERRTELAQRARLRAEEADAAKSRFLALMSHEMRTPLNSVTGYAEVLIRRPDMDPVAIDHLGHIQRSGDALLMLVEDVLEISRGDDALSLAPLCLSDVIGIAASPSRIAAEDKGLNLTIDIRPDAGVMFVGDRRRLRQALHHLISNAVKFTERGTVSILADRIGDEVLIAITDSGCGLDTAGADRLFEAFVQGDDSISRTHIGAGIGLSLVQRHAALMGGSVVVDSRPGDGATFTLRLPLALAEASAARTHTRAAPAPVEIAEDDDGPAAAPRILVVDDHPANREVARLMLTAVGCETAEACDGDEAIAMAATQAFDLILMDVRMPRVDGLAATRAIRAAGNTVPILAVTADAMPEDAARCLAAGMDDHLPKPISHHALYAAMERLLSGERAEPAPAKEAEAA
jgi:signal transduction histidine kinase/ActR/RegA family two-component response regulator